MRLIPSFFESLLSIPCRTVEFFTIAWLPCPIFLTPFDYPIRPNIQPSTVPHSSQRVWYVPTTTTFLYVFTYLPLARILTMSAHTLQKNWSGSVHSLLKSPTFFHISNFSSLFNIFLPSSKLFTFLNLSIIALFLFFEKNSKYLFVFCFLSSLNFLFDCWNNGDEGDVLEGKTKKVKIKVSQCLLMEKCSGLALNVILRDGQTVTFFYNVISISLYLGIIILSLAPVQAH